MPNAKPQRVGIVGAGLAACCLAILLARQGMQVELFEVREEDSTKNLGGGLAIAPNAVRVIDEIGCLDAVKAAGKVFEEMHVLTEKGTELGTLQNGSVPLYGYPAVRIMRASLHHVLVEKAKNTPNVTIHWQRKVVDVSQTADAASITLADGSSASFDLAIGADGIHSRVRNSLYRDNPPDNAFQGVVSIGGFVDEQHMTAYRLPAIIYGQTGTLGCFVLPEGRATWFATLEVADDRGREGWAKWHTSGESIKQLQSQFSDWSGPFKTCIDNATPEKTSYWAQYSVADMPAWVCDRIVLIGDAAHALPPSGGQGSAMAFEDASLLARCIKDGLPFSAWEKERRRRVALIREMTRYSGKTRTVGRASWLAFAIKTSLMWAYFKSGFASKDMTGVYGYDGSKVELQ